MDARELIDRQKFIEKAIKEPNEYETWASDNYKISVDAFDEFPTVSEQEIIKPYLTKLRAEIISSIEDIKGKYDNTVPEHDRPLCKSARNETRLEIIDMIDNLLSEQGEQE